MVRNDIKESVILIRCLIFCLFMTGLIEAVTSTGDSWLIYTVSRVGVSLLSGFSDQKEWKSWLLFIVFLAPYSLADWSATWILLLHANRNACLENKSWFSQDDIGFFFPSSQENLSTHSVFFLLDLSCQISCWPNSSLPGFCPIFHLCSGNCSSYPIKRLCKWVKYFLVFKKYET